MRIYTCTRIHTRVCVAYVFVACVTKYMYEYLRIYVFPALLLQCTVSLVFHSLFAVFSFHVLPTIQFIRRIILGNVENRGWLSTFSLLLPGRCLCRTSSNPFFYVPASIAAKSQWLDRGSIPRQHTSTRSSWFCSNMADRHVFPSSPD